MIRMMDDIWAKVAGSGIVIFLSTVFGIKIAQAKTQTKLESPQTSITELKTSFGREIGELKDEVKTIRKDFYKPRVDD